MRRCGHGRIWLGFLDTSRRSFDRCEVLGFCVLGLVPRCVPNSDIGIVEAVDQGSIAKRLIEMNRPHCIGTVPRLLRRCILPEVDTPSRRICACKVAGVDVQNPAQMASLLRLLPSWLVLALMDVAAQRHPEQSRTHRRTATSRCTFSTAQRRTIASSTSTAALGSQQALIPATSFRDDIRDIHVESSGTESGCMTNRKSGAPSRCTTLTQLD